MLILYYTYGWVHAHPVSHQHYGKIRMNRHLIVELAVISFLKLGISDRERKSAFGLPAGGLSFLLPRNHASGRKTM